MSQVHATLPEWQSARPAKIAGKSRSTEASTSTASRSGNTGRLTDAEAAEYARWIRLGVRRWVRLGMRLRVQLGVRRILTIGETMKVEWLGEYKADVVAR